MTEYGIFSDEGLIEGNLYSLESAAEALAGYIAEEVDGGPPGPTSLYVAEVCPYHEEQTREHCEECAEDAEDAEDVEDAEEEESE